MSNESAETIPFDPGQPIFVLGIMRRSGTNFLQDLLALHPDCTTTSNLSEDFVISELRRLATYVDKVSSHWNTKWNVEGFDRNLTRAMGNSLLTFLNGGRRDQSCRLVTKTPSVQSLPFFPEFFPQAHAVIIVRQGESSIESGMRSFNWPFHWATKAWTRGAETIAAFAESNSGPGANHIVVRYEDLYSDTEAELRRIFTRVNLDPAKYDFKAALNLPVRGSSMIRHEGGQPVHWKPVEKSADFNPLKRATAWSPWQRAQFAWLAGRSAEKLGYRVDTSYNSNPFWVAYNLLLSSKAGLALAGEKITRRLQTK